VPKIGPLRPSEFSDIRACARQTNLGRHGAVGWNRAGVRRLNTEAEPHRARIQRDDISRYHSRITLEGRNGVLTPFKATLWVHAFDAPAPRPGRRVGRDERRGCGRRSRLSASTQRRTRRSRATRATSAASAQSRPCIRSRTVRGGDGNDGGRGEMHGAPLRPAPALSTNSCRLCPHPSAHHFFPSRRRRMSSRIGGVARRAS
jgi:hypothetical protein